MGKIWRKTKRYWQKGWMNWAGLSRFGRFATRMAAWATPPYKSRTPLANLGAKGFVAPSAIIYHQKLQLNRGVYIGDRVTIYQSRDGGEVILEPKVHLYSDITIETGEGGQVILGEAAHIQPRCQFSAYKGSIRIGKRAEIAPNCAFYPYNHQMEPGQTIRDQPLHSRGDIIIGDDVWLGFGVVVLEGVEIGDGAVIGAGSVVSQNIPQQAIAVGVPARVIKYRHSEKV
jgi:acetyltransferase-like isoleucine patch superfamily enzyme